MYYIWQSILLSIIGCQYPSLPDWWDAGGLCFCPHSPLFLQYSPYLARLMRCWRTLFLSPPSAPSHTPFSWTCWIFWRATPTTCFLKSKSSRRIFRFSMRLGAVSLFKQKNIFYTMGLSKANQYNCLINIIYNMRKKDTDIYMTSRFTKS